MGRRRAVNLVRDHEDLAGDERGPAEAVEWAHVGQLRATAGGVYAPDADAVVQDELAVAAERERARKLEDDKRRQEEAEAARRAALSLQPTSDGTLQITGSDRTGQLNHQCGKQA